MTSLLIPSNQLPPVNPFLISVCPGFPSDYLEENVHYSLNCENLPKSTREVIYNSSSIKLDSTYLNVSRPSLNKNESNTYVSLAYHITNLFKKIVANDEKGSERNLHIGANINPLNQDPFKYLTLNPSCMTRVIDLNTKVKKNSSPFNPFNKLVNLLKPTNFKDLKEHTSVKILKLSNYNLDDISKLIVSTHVNILNVFQLDKNNNFENTKKIQTKSPIIPFTEETINEKIIEEPILRIKFDDDLIITALSTVYLKSECVIILGFQNGDIMYLNLNDLKYQIFHYNQECKKISTDGVTTIECINHPNYEFLIIAGYSNGEIIILNVFGEVEEYHKKTVFKDANITYFRQFDLSPFTTNQQQIIGHFKLSHKPITSISSTLPLNKPYLSDSQPLLVAIASDDGFVKIIDLLFTFDEKNIVTDVISNYFNCCITEVKFSFDYKFLVIVGNGDLIEVFKVSYYNINGLLKGRKKLDENINYPPMMKDIQIVTRLKGHTNTVKSIKFLEEDSSTNSYKLISCGFDGKVIIWEFDYKALPKIKLPTKKDVKKHEKKQSIPHALPIKNVRNSLLSPPSFTNLTNSTTMNMTSLLQQDEQQQVNYDPEIIFSLYKSLYEIRLKRFYKKKNKYQNIILPITNDKLVPSIIIPSCVIDL
ncbi:unnamed protein product [Candida verbasci]|uniref:Uncharacterized protein n=1 Tax=Candida verbasci TaxID=1227364 RepID=A0A9W4XJ23_9ASCO|nr:unnamed protein product [Candida verbasci]